MKRGRAGLVVWGLLAFAVFPASSRLAETPPAAPPTPAPPAVAPAPVVDSPALQAHIRELIQVIEAKPSGVVINNSGQVAAPPGQSPYNPDGTRNQNFMVIHDNSQGPAAIVLNADQRRVQALQELIKIGKPAVPELVRALMTEIYDYRRYYAFALGEIRDPRAVPALIKYLEDGRQKLKIAPQLRASGNVALAQKLEDDGKRMIADATDNLQRITGQNYGPDLARWNQWWEANKAAVGPTPPFGAYTANPPPPVIHYPPPPPTPSPAP